MYDEYIMIQDNQLQHFMDNCIQEQTDIQNLIKAGDDDNSLLKRLGLLNTMIKSIMKLKALQN
jgi:hypothetical protein